jgi:D-alanyl-D-alanine carboxypeptidase
VAAHAWQRGCPVPLSGLRLLTVTYVGFDDRTHTGQLVVNARHAADLAKVFRKLYAIRFPIHHMSLAMYGPPRTRPVDRDLTGSFECRQAVPSPCTGGAGTGSWSEHAYGEAIDLNPIENPYVGCGMSRDKASRAYIDRSRLRKGMVTPEVVAAFRSIGWGWGGAWSGSTKDYMHFSQSGH